MQFLKQSTASQTRILGPFVDDTDGKTAETALTINASDVKLMANGAASVNKNSGGGTHRVNGMYAITLDATDTATVGELAVSVVVAGALPVFAKFFVLEEAVFDALFGASSVGPLTTLGTNAPANWINAAAIASDAITSAKVAAAALNGKGDWNVGKTGYGLTSDERNTLAGVIDSRLLDDGDATDLIAGIVARLGTVDIDETSLVAAIKAALIHAEDIANKIHVSNEGIVAANLLQIGSDDSFVGQLNTALDEGLLGLDTSEAIAAIKEALFDESSITHKLSVDADGAVVASVTYIADTYADFLRENIANDVSAKIATDIESDLNGWDVAYGYVAELVSSRISYDITNDERSWDEAKAAIAGLTADAVWDEARTGHTTAGTFGFYLDAAISSVSGGGGGGGDDAATIYTYFTDGTRANAFKADVSTLSTFDATTDEVIVATNNDKTGYALTSGERDTLAGVIDSRLLDDGDATDLIASIVTRIGNTNVDEAAFVAAVKAALFDAGSAANKLAVDSSGRVTVGTNSDKTGYSLTTAPLDASGIRSAVGLASANLDTQLSSIEATVDTEAVASALAPLLAGTTINIESPIFSGDEGQDLSLIQGDDYASRPVRINIESEEDLTEFHFVIAARLQSNTATKLGLRMQIQSDDDGQFALFAPTAEQTEAWAAGTYELRHRIQYDTNKFKTIKNGILTISPFDTPTPLVDVDP